MQRARIWGFSKGPGGERRSHSKSGRLPGDLKDQVFGLFHLLGIGRGLECREQKSFGRRGFKKTEDDPPFFMRGQGTYFYSLVA